MRYLLILLVAAMSALTTACSSPLSNLKPFKLEIQQGNVVTSKMLLQLRPGMTKSQVRYIMGSPLIADSFHGNRWDYIFQLRQAGKFTEQKRVVLEFETDLLKTVRGDVEPVAGEAGVVKLTPAAEIVAPKNKNKKDEAGESFTDKLKFWKSDDKPAPVDSLVPVEKPSIPVEKKPALELVPVTMDSVPAPVGVKTGAVVEALKAETLAHETLAPEAVAVEPATTMAITETKLEVTPLQVVPAATEPVAQAVDLVVDAIPVPVNPSSGYIGVRENAGLLSEYELKFERALEVNYQAKNARSQTPSATPNSAQPDVILDTNASPGYFERMLEKIGF